jgi:hypothetical protein
VIPEINRISGIKGIVIRRAIDADVLVMMAALEDVSSEIPLRLDGAERKARILDLIADCCRSGESLVAMNDRKQLLGFQLTRPIALRYLVSNGPKQPAGLSLEYGGIAKNARGKGLFSSLIEQTKKRRLPLYAIVRHDNHSKMADRLIQMEFEKIGSDSDFPQDHFRWLPTEVCSLLT